MKIFLLLPKKQTGVKAKHEKKQCERVAAGASAGMGHYGRSLAFRLKKIRRGTWSKAKDSRSRFAR